MTDPRRSTRAMRWRGLTGLALLGILALVVAVVAAKRSGAPGPRAQGEDPGVAHVHGLGINPGDGDLYAATHMGVFHISPEGKGTRIADRFQDTMGFTVRGSDHFIASGHPDLSEELPPLLGLIESKDAAKSWKALSLRGEADFHVLRFVHDQIYGYDSTGGRLMVSKDGRKWSELSDMRLGDFVVNPTDREVIVSTTARGLQRSEDGGRTWSVIDGPPGATLLAWPSAMKLWLIDEDGRVYLSSDGGRRWDDRGAIGGTPEAFLAVDDEMYAATEKGILKSADDGRNWTLLFSEQAHGSDS